jgi:hypothetical protein
VGPGVEREVVLPGAYLQECRSRREKSVEGKQPALLSGVEKLRVGVECRQLRLSFPQDPEGYSVLLRVHVGAFFRGPAVPLWGEFEMYSDHLKPNHRDLLLEDGPEGGFPGWRMSSEAPPDLYQVTEWPSTWADRFEELRQENADLREKVESLRGRLQEVRSAVGQEGWEV